MNAIVPMPIMITGMIGMMIMMIICHPPIMINREGDT